MLRIVSKSSLSNLVGRLRRKESRSDKMDMGVHLMTVVVILCFNESRTIGSVVLKAKMQKVDKVVVIDDGSWDDSAEVAMKAGAEVISMSITKVWRSSNDSLRYGRRSECDVLSSWMEMGNMMLRIFRNSSSR